MLINAIPVPPDTTIVLEFVLSVTQPAQHVHQNQFVVAVQLGTLFKMTNVALQERQIVLLMV
jgi:hypothetical protein